MAGQSPLTKNVKTESIDREHVIERLKYAFSYDYIEVEEFEERLEAATSTKNKAELQTLVADLPPIKPREKKETNEQVEKTRDSFKKNGLILGILGGMSKKNKWRVPRKLHVTAFMGGVNLDFTRAVVPPGIVEINIFSIMGGVDIIVPPGINVDADGFAIMGGFDDKSYQDVRHPEASTLKIRGFALMGGIDIKTPKEKLLSKILKKFHIID